MQKGLHSAQAHSADQIRLLTSAIDKAAKRGIIHRNAARRRKERLTRALATAK
jgi:ribosomal protein S20